MFLDFLILNDFGLFFIFSIYFWLFYFTFLVLSPIICYFLYIIYKSDVKSLFICYMISPSFFCIYVFYDNLVDVI